MSSNLRYLVQTPTPDLNLIATTLGPGDRDNSGPNIFTRGMSLRSWCSQKERQFDQHQIKSAGRLLHKLS